MGDPKKSRKKYQTPSHPWIKARIDEEAEIVKEYGFKTKQEIWKVDSKLRNFARIAKKLIPRKDKQAVIETKQLLDKLTAMGLLEADSQLDKVLNINLKVLLDRRLQSMVCKKGFAKTMKQARQFITHRHVAVNGKVITSPSYLVSKKEEAVVQFLHTSALANPEHPERALALKPAEAKELKAIKEHPKKVEEKVTKE
ncbi:MAG: 30S ribosomal protein S4 [Candidatus Woesearchaeota archaeon]